MKWWTRRLAAAAVAVRAGGRAGIVSPPRPGGDRPGPRDGRHSRIAVKIPVLLAAIVVAGTAAGPASASVPGWSVTPSPNPVVATGQLFWVSCPAANSCMAVGTYVRASGAGVTLAERWNGSRWRIQPIPSPPGAAFSALLGVSCVARSACEAVGATVSRLGAQTPLAERWDGSKWQAQAAPTPAGGGALNGVSCISPVSCTAVGGSARGKALAERWDGARWSIQATPNPPQGSGFLSGVACTSPSACTAVGASNTCNPSAR
jgi:hypothetical protein